MKILSVCLGRPERLRGKQYKTGIYKHPIGGAVLIDEEGLVGDAICNSQHHGGADQAILLEGSLTLGWWAQELGVTLEPGAFGENLIIQGLDNRQVCVGDRFIAGDLVLEATSARIPCATFAAKMGDPRFVKRYAKAGRPGVYCRVLAGGTVEAGLPVEYVPYAGAGVTMPEMMASFGRKLSDEDRARYLAAPIHRKLRAALEG